MESLTRKQRIGLLATFLAIDGLIIAAVLIKTGILGG